MRLRAQTMLCVVLVGSACAPTAPGRTTWTGSADLSQSSLGMTRRYHEGHSSLRAVSLHIGEYQRFTPGFSDVADDASAYMHRRVRSVLSLNADEVDYRLSLSLEFAF